MNEVKLLNIGGIDQNVKDQYARDIIAPSENGLDSTSNLPVASRPYKTGEFLIGQDRLYYEAIDDIEIGDTLVVNVNIKATTVSNELASLRNKSADAAIECIAPMEKTGLSSAEYKVGEYLYWDYGTDAGLYKAKVAINIGDAFIVDTNIETAPNIESQIQTLSNQINKAYKYDNTTDTTIADADYIPFYDTSAGVMKKITKAKFGGRALYFTNVACSATTGNFVNYSNSAITKDHVVTEIYFSDPSAITSDGFTWSTETAGKITINGTCARAMTCSIVLVEKDN